MAHDQVVRARDVLRSIMAVRRQGSVAVLRQLEQTEPDLTEFLLEEMSAIHQLVLALRGKPRREKRVVRRAESMALVLVTALREARLRLWQDGGSDIRPVSSDPSPRADSSADAPRQITPRDGAPPDAVRHDPGGSAGEDGDPTPRGREEC